MSKEIWRDPDGGREEYDRLKGILMKYNVPEVQGKELEGRAVSIMANLTLVEAKSQWRQRVLGRLVTLLIFGAVILAFYFLWGKGLPMW